MATSATRNKRAAKMEVKEDAVALAPDQALVERLGSISSERIEQQAAGEAPPAKQDDTSHPKHSGASKPQRRDQVFSVDSRRGTSDASASITQKLELGDSIVSRIFERRFAHASRNIYFLISYARALISSREPHLAADWPADKVEERARELGLDETLAKQGVDGLLRLIEQSVNRHIDLLAKDLETTLSGLNAKIEEYGIDTPTYDSTTHYSVGISSPQSMKYLRLYRLADEVALATNIAWIHGIIDAEAKDSGFYTHVKLPLNDVAHLARDLYVYVQRRWSEVVRPIPGSNDHDNKKKIERGQTAAERADAMAKQTQG